jgi:flagellar biosynthesis/type III secretory pathway M-ring protein FliF/YscJ
MENKKLFYSIIGGVVLVMILIIVLVVVGSGNQEEKVDEGAKPLTEEQLLLAGDISAGKAVEIRALLSRQNIRLDAQPGTGGKVSLFFSEEATLNDRDQALLTMAQSGLMDGKLGMEAFDTSDMMASREEKQIKLIRGQEGDLARIIRKMPPVEDAHVKISVPDPTLFSSDRRPPSAAVQVTLPPGERLTRDKVRAIINLMVGGIQGLEAKHVALSDTNGNTYNSVLDSALELQDKAADQDFYMKQKIAAQLDKLIGEGRYVVTVSTFLRESPKETMVQNYDPAKSVVANKQRFQETLGGGSQAKTFGKSGGAVSGFLPPELDSKVAIGQSVEGMANREENTAQDGYLREGTEVSYQNGHTQWVETSVPGMVEDVSIAVTIDDDFYPNIPPEDLQVLVARAASPRVNPMNVSLARTDFENPKPLEGDDPLPEPPMNSASFLLPGLSPEASAGVMTWLPWMAISIIGVVVAMMLLGNKGKVEHTSETLESAINELQALRQHAEQTQSHLQYQQQLNEQLMQAQQQQQQELNRTKQQNVEKLKEALKDLNENLKESSPSAPRIRPKDVNLRQWFSAS